jgi:hypothetical protein
MLAAQTASKFNLPAEASERKGKYVENRAGEGVDDRASYIL